MNTKSEKSDKRFLRKPLITCFLPMVGSILAAVMFTPLAYFAAKFLYVPERKFDTTTALILFVGLLMLGVWPTVRNLFKLHRGHTELKEKEAKGDGAV